MDLGGPPLAPEEKVQMRKLDHWLKGEKRKKFETVKRYILEK